MKIFVIYLGRRGSGGSISLALSRGLARYTQVQAVISSQAENLPAWQASRLPFWSVPTFQNAWQAFWSMLFPLAQARLVQRIRDAGADVLIFPMQHPWNTYLQRALHPIPNIFFVHDPLPHAGFTGWWHELMARANMRFADHYIVLSHTFIATLEKQGIAPERISVLPHGILTYPLMERKNATFTLLFFGRIAPYKGLEVLLQAYTRLIQSHPDVSLLIAGEGNMKPYCKYLQNLARVTVINRWIAEDEISAIFSQADALVLPYTSATQSGVLALAASYGLALVATRTGGLVEQIEDGVSGILVAPASVDDLLDALQRLLENPSWARALGENLRCEYETNRNWDVLALRLLETAHSLPVR